MKFKEFHLKDARASPFKNPMLKLIDYLRHNRGKFWEQSFETLPILIAIVVLYL